MRDPARIDRMIELLRTAWHGAPDLRLGQLVYNLLTRDGYQIFHVEDDVAERKLEAYLRDGFRAAQETR